MFDIPRLFAEVDMQELGYRTFLTDRRLISLPRTSMQLIKQLLLQSIKERKNSDKSRSGKCNATYHTATGNADSTTQ